VQHLVKSYVRLTAGKPSRCDDVMPKTKKAVKKRASQIDELCKNRAERCRL
jgi:hypothetical protein